ncbi:unnamed protein product [Callosobruchus maculatus]|uniref:Uncharacterized protein n=1 Tax=Callosobruchus maculatus TaxID=64391 RepID=A0A653D951_CALMS|nr:unnamed protein product [Callosobruchus maculatus]
MVTPYFSKLCHGHHLWPVECALPELSMKNRGTQNFELSHNGLLTLFLDDCHALYLRS